LGDVPVEEVAKLPPPGAAIPTAIAFSPDDTAVTFLHSADASLRRELYAVDVATGRRSLVLAPAEGGDTEETLSPEEKLRRERRRDLGVGVTTYAWSEEGDLLLVPLQGAVHVKNGIGGTWRQLVADAGAGDDADHPTLDPRPSRDGSAVAFVRDAEVYVVDAGGGDPVQVTAGARAVGRTNGLAEFIAQEEMGRATGYWWSRDGRYLAFAEVDETHIPPFRIGHLGTARPAEEEHRYPFAGHDNAVVRLGVVPCTGGAPVWLDLGGADRYLARVHWLPDGAIAAEVEHRDQHTLELYRYDPTTGHRTLLLTEKSDIWINLHDGFRPLDDGGFLWLSERSGFRHIYRHDDSGAPLAQLTDGEWMVDGLAAVDEAAGVVWFTATKDGPRQRHLYSVALGGGAMLRVTREPGTHHVVIDHGRRRFVDVHSSAAAPPSATLRDLQSGETLYELHASDDPRIGALGLEAPELAEFTTGDGTTLHAALYHPDSQQFGMGPHPLVVSVYGGPHAQLVVDEWRATASMRAQHLRSRGFLVAVIDNRGSARRGLAFEGSIGGRLGHLEVQDQVAGVRWLVERGLVDASRVGIYGWSYGGYMALMCLAQAPDVFKAAVAGAPVTHWDGYDTHYTERYMGMPDDNVDGYEHSSVMHHVAGIRGQVLLVHGLLDENVHFRHTARLVNAMIAARVPYDLLLFPDERHSPRRVADRVYMEERISAFFTANLGG
jgi:dipeptidyl-peptidase-4